MLRTCYIASSGIDEELMMFLRDVIKVHVMMSMTTAKILKEKGTVELVCRPPSYVA